MAQVSSVSTSCQMLSRLLVRIVYLLRLQQMQSNIRETSWVFTLSKRLHPHLSCGCRWIYGCENLCVSSAGFPLNDQLFPMIIRRYSDENGNMDFDNYIGCLVRLDAMCRKFTLWNEADAVQTFYHDDSENRLIVTFPHSGAFKTLDKDNNGTIKVNVQEVKCDLNYLKFDFGVFWFWWRE